LPAPSTAIPLRARERAGAQRYGEAAMLHAAEAVLRARGVPAKLEFTHRAGRAGEDAWLRIGHGRSAVRYAVEAPPGQGAGVWVLRDLKKMGHIVELGRRPGARGRARTRRLEQRRRLLDLWVQAFPGQLRPRLHPPRLQATQPGWWRTADFARYGLALGGEPATERLTQHLKPETIPLSAVGGGGRFQQQAHK